MGNFDNENRNRYYGIRVGDIVTSRLYGSDFHGRVIKYGFLDNNMVVVLTDSGEEKRCVAEWLQIETKVEDINGK
jgi:hypothetical protein